MDVAEMLRDDFSDDLPKKPTAHAGSKGGCAESGEPEIAR